MKSLMDADESLRNLLHSQGHLWNFLRDAYELLKEIYEKSLVEADEIPMESLWKSISSLRNAYEILKDIYEILQGSLSNPQWNLWKEYLWNPVATLREIFEILRKSKEINEVWMRNQWKPIESNEESMKSDTNP